MSLSPTLTPLLNPLTQSASNPNPTQANTSAKVNPKPDAFQQTKAKPAQSASALRFGSNSSRSFGQHLKHIGSVTLGVISGVGLAVGLPLGLMQLAAGIILHPLLITGGLTIGIPVAGLLASYLLGRKK